MNNNQRYTYRGVIQRGRTAARSAARALLWSLCLSVLLSCSYSPEVFSPSSFSRHLPNNTLTAVQEAGVLKVITRDNPTTYYQDKYGPSGFEYSLAAEFATELGVDLEIIVAKSLQEIFTALETGRAHVAAAGLTITKEREEILQFGAPYLDITQQVIYRAGTKRPWNMGQINNGNMTVVADSSHSAMLMGARKEYKDLSWKEAQLADSIDLMDLLHQGKIDYTIVDSNEFLAYHGLFPGLRVAFDLKQPEQFGWALAKRPASQALHQAVVQFFRRTEKDGTLDLLKERFYGHAPAVNQTGMLTFAKNRRNRLPKYKELIKSVADEHDMSWHLLAAIGYQESHWNPKAVSPTGVRGMMMLTRTTAKEMQIADRTDVKQSLHGGARYFKRMLKRIPDDVTGQDRYWFALAAYNVGIGHLYDARRITKVQGGDPTKWADVEQRLPLLQQQEWYSKTHYGYARGQEPVTYVQNIRRYYHILALNDLAESRQSSNIELVSYQPSQDDAPETTVL